MSNEVDRETDTLRRTFEGHIQIQTILQIVMIRDKDES